MPESTLGGVDIRPYVTLGGVDIRPYVGSVTPYDSARIGEIEALRTRLAKDNLPAQRVPLLRLEEQRIGFEYPLLDTSFLGMHSIQVRGDRGGWILPKFSAHYVFGAPRTSEEEASDFSMVFEWVSRSYPSVCFVPRLPTILERSLLNATGFARDSREISSGVIDGRLWHQFEGLPSEKRGPLYSLGHTHRLRTSFNGIIPEETVENIRRAGQFFDNSELFIVRETKPEDWNITVQVVESKDPFVIGVKRDKCFLVDTFDATSLEKYVTEEFTSGFRE